MVLFLVPSERLRSELCDPHYKKLQIFKNSLP